MQQKNFNIKNNILNFVYNNTDYSINLDQLEQVHLYRNNIVFISVGNVKLIPDDCLDFGELILKLLDNPNFIVCGEKYVVNLKFVKSAHIESFKNGDGYSDLHNVVLVYKNGREGSILANSWREAERLYHEIDGKLEEIASNQVFSN